MDDAPKNKRLTDFICEAFDIRPSVAAKWVLLMSKDPEAAEALEAENKRLKDEIETAYRTGVQVGWSEAHEKCEGQGCGLL